MYYNTLIPYFVGNIVCTEQTETAPKEQAVCKIYKTLS